MSSKPLKAFLVQVDRGHANDAQTAISILSIGANDNNHVHDTRIQRWSERVTRGRGAIAQGPRLRTLHIQCREHHKDRIAALLDDQEKQRTISPRASP
jgi:hypothetical protein